MIRRPSQSAFGFSVTTATRRPLADIPSIQPKQSA
jgi:hypothetical protein